MNKIKGKGSFFERIGKGKDRICKTQRTGNSQYVMTDEVIHGVDVVVLYGHVHG